ncbi:MAG TPA: hypothetical protein VFY81_00100 [Gammaproteobacteria bacterium]|nr:hypothetical protein [Gammaproteobacteria bacterium]
MLTPRTWLAAALLVVFSSTLYLKLALDFEQLKVSAQYDVLFDSDPNTRIACYATGWGSGRSFAHPNLCNLVNPPVRIVAAALIKSGMVDNDVDHVRRQVALVVAPVTGGLTVGLLFATLLLLGVKPMPACMLAALYAVSFSQLIFASIPDHPALGALSIALPVWLLVASITRHPQRPLFWVVAGVLAFSITITNFLIFLFLLALALLHTGGYRQALRQGLKVAALALAAALLVKLPLDLRYGGSTDIGTVSGFAQDWLREEGIRAALSYPRVLVESIAAPEPIIMDNPRFAPDGSGYPFLLWLEGGRYNNVFSLAAALLLSALMLGGLARGLATALDIPAERTLFVAIAGLLLFNGFFHGVWGSQYFLYSQHWLFASCILIAFPLRQPGLAAKAAAVGAFATVILTAAGNYQILSFIFALLESSRVTV